MPKTAAAKGERRLRQREDDRQTVELRRREGAALLDKHRRFINEDAYQADNTEDEKERRVQVSIQAQRDAEAEIVAFEEDRDAAENVANEAWDALYFRMADAGYKASLAFASAKERFAQGVLDVDALATQLRDLELQAEDALLDACTRWTAGDSAQERSVRRRQTRMSANTRIPDFARDRAWFMREVIHAHILAFFYTTEATMTFLRVDQLQTQRSDRRESRRKDAREKKAQPRYADEPPRRGDSYNMDYIHTWYDYYDCRQDYYEAEGFYYDFTQSDPIPMYFKDERDVNIYELYAATYDYAPRPEELASSKKNDPENRYELGSILLDTIPRGGLYDVPEPLRLNPEPEYYDGGTYTVRFRRWRRRRDRTRQSAVLDAAVQQPGATAPATGLSARASVVDAVFASRKVA